MSISNIIDSLINEDMSSIKLSNKGLKYSNLSPIRFVNNLSSSDYNAINHNMRSNDKVIISFIATDKIAVVDVGSVSYGDSCIGFVYQIKGRADTIRNCLDTVLDVINNGGFSDIDDFLHRMNKYNIAFYSDVGFDIQKRKFISIDFMIKSFVSSNTIINRDIYDEMSKLGFKEGRDYTLECGISANKSKTNLYLYCTLDFTTESGLYEGSVFYDKIVDFLRECFKGGQCRGIIPYDTFIAFSIYICR